jgi:hypothetical protein
MTSSDMLWSLKKHLLAACWDDGKIVLFAFSSTSHLLDSSFSLTFAAFQLGSERQVVLAKDQCLEEMDVDPP